MELSGRGTLHSWIKPVHPRLPTFPDDYWVALVDLEEGVRLLSNLCEVELEEIENDMPVEVCFAPTTEGGRIHHFRPRGKREDG